VILYVVDVAGHPVQKPTADRTAGEHLALWDLRNQRGEVVRPGLYFVVLSAHPSRLVKRVVVLAD